MKALLGIVLLLFAIPLTAQKNLVFIDTDAGDDIDDAYAIALALRSPQLDVDGITTAYGDTTLRAHLVKRLTIAAGHPDLLVLAGIEGESNGTFTQTAYARGDHHHIPSIVGVDFLLDQVRLHPHKLTLIALGPLTNIAAALKEDPESFRTLRRIILMGGSIHRGYGNHPAEPEWNIKCDPAAAQKVFASGVPITMLPLDATQIGLPASTQQQIFAQPGKLGPALQELTREFNHTTVTLYDAVTVAYAAHPELCHPVAMHIEIDDAGMTTATPGKPNAQACLSIDEAAFNRILKDRLAPRH